MNSTSWPGLTETRISDKARWVRSGFRQIRGHCLVGSGPISVLVVEFGTGLTRLRRWSGLVVSFLNSTTRTRPDMSAPATRSLTKPGLCLIPLHGPTDFVCDLTRPEPRTKSVHIETERTSLRPDKVGGLAGDLSGPWVWSGRFRVVEFRNDTTRPDQRQNLAGRV